MEEQVLVWGGSTQLWVFGAGGRDGIGIDKVLVG